MSGKEGEKDAKRKMRYMIYIALIIAACISILIVSLLHPFNSNPGKIAAGIKPTNANSLDATPRLTSVNAWKAPGENTIPKGKAGETIKYGRELLAHTAQYFGPKGSVAQITNGMNCQNCHLDAGTKLFGNNFASFISGYPKLSNRSGRMAKPAERIAECFERSLAGKVPDTAGKEVQAILSYMKWLGRDVKKGQEMFGNATEKLPFLDEAADPAKGKIIFAAKCQSCHGEKGEGVHATDQITYTYPPLWGKNSYNDGAGMYRLGNFAGFVKNNMPLGATYQNPQLTNEEAWNVAAFVNTQPRPHKDQQRDWPDLMKKPIDFPFGPYIDTFSEKQHKLGPFKPIKNAQK
ncbi:c-type cytochrome [Mucilaginibacter glaciei]|uniref:C-type cytochrome n=1 Tax=Mucilaginibacter glaciei TaxID=2772109 RepID=A0A926NUD1_9SPHI|nr:c-type cytochrome [Mucilaginibacter glaciei]MBD1391933.1 c-type cytochrome [Mucilaginibacter glaciei]